jgi:Flp pilus assembly protein CpaB
MSARPSFRTCACWPSTRRSRRRTDSATATLELSEKRSEQLTNARQLGTITLALRSIVDAGEKQVVVVTAPPEQKNVVPTGPPANRIVIYRGGRKSTLSCAPVCQHEDAPAESADPPAPPPAK